MPRRKRRSLLKNNKGITKQIVHLSLFINGASSWRGRFADNFSHQGHGIIRCVVTRRKPQEESDSKKAEVESVKFLLKVASLSARPP